MRPGMKTMLRAHIPGFASGLVRRAVRPVRGGRAGIVRVALSRAIPL